MVFFRKIIPTVTSFAIFCNTPFPGTCLTTIHQEAYAQHILDHAEKGEVEEIINILEKQIEKSGNNAFQQSRQLLQSFIDEINHKYKMSLTISDACRLIRENIYSFPCESRECLIFATELFESNHQSKEFVFERVKISHARHLNFYWPWEWNWFGLNHHPSRSLMGKLAQKSKTRVNKSPELELPPHMAVGFACTLAGAFCLILPIPGAQIVGGNMIVIGSGLMLEGLAQGEKPHYVDSVTKKPFPPIPVP